MTFKKTIGIFAPSLTVDLFKGALTYSPLIKHDFQVKETLSLKLKYKKYFAGSVSERVKDFHNLLLDNDVDIIMTFWGGLNTNQLLPYINYELFKNHYKPVIGYSDTSALLLSLYKMTGLTTYMGPAGITFNKPDFFNYTLKYFQKVVCEQNNEIIVNDSKEYADDLYFLREDSEHRIIRKNTGRKVYKHGVTQGKAIAANLQTLLILAGTPYFPDLKDTVLFLEEDESASPPTILRFLTQLIQLEQFAGVKAICFGRFMIDSGFDEEFSVKSLFDEVFADLNIPIVYDLDFGHSDPMFTIPIGVTAYIDTENNVLKFIL